MRLFIGIDLPQSTRESLDLLVARFRTLAKLKWSPTGNLHITTKFIGEWPEARLNELIAKLQTVTATGRVEIAVRGLGWFPNPQRPRVFWAGVSASPALADLARATERACADLGITVENRPFSPHLTLARIKDPVPLDALRKAIADLESADFGRFVAPSHKLYLSKLGPSGSIYTPLAEFPLPA